MLKIGNWAKFREFDGKISLFDFVFVKNFIRQHLNSAKSGDIALKILPEFEEIVKKR